MQFFWTSDAAVRNFNGTHSISSCHKLVGNDTRKIIADGFPIEGVLASDIQTSACVVTSYVRTSLTDLAEFWDLGHELFRSTPETFPVPFITGDVFDPLILEPVSPLSDTPKTAMPSLNTLSSLNPLRGYVSAIHASSFFHLFNEEKQFKLARALAALLSPEPGSVIFGSHGGLPVKGTRMNSMGSVSFCHSPESWQKLWDGQIFEPGKVKVEVLLTRPERTDPDKVVERFLLVWSVTRL